LQGGLPISAAACPGEAPLIEYRWQPDEETVINTTFAISEAVCLISVAENDPVLDVVPSVFSLLLTVHHKSPIMSTAELNMITSRQAIPLRSNSFQQSLKPFTTSRGPFAF
jgi:hypothetical protein